MAVRRRFLGSSVPAPPRSRNMATNPGKRQERNSVGSPRWPRREPTPQTEYYACQAKRFCFSSRWVRSFWTPENRMANTAPETAKSSAAWWASGSRNVHSPAAVESLWRSEKTASHGRTSSAKVAAFGAMDAESAAEPVSGVWKTPDAELSSTKTGSSAPPAKAGAAVDGTASDESTTKVVTPPAPPSASRRAVCWAPIRFVLMGVWAAAVCCGPALAPLLMDDAVTSPTVNNSAAKPGCGFTAWTATRPAGVSATTGVAETLTAVGETSIAVAVVEPSEAAVHVFPRPAKFATKASVSRKALAVPPKKLPPVYSASVAEVTVALPALAAKSIGFE